MNKRFRMGFLAAAFATAASVATFNGAGAASDNKPPQSAALFINKAVQKDGTEVILPPRRPIVSQKQIEQLFRQ